MVLKDSTFGVGRNKKIWIDKRLKVYYGIKSLRTKQIQWYLIGTFVYVNVSYSFTQNERKVSLSCADLMAEYDGTLNGKIGGYGSANSSLFASQGLIIPAGEDIRESVIATLKDANIKSYVVEDIHKEIPFDLTFNTGVTYADVWKRICELYDTWEYFFDVDGTFIWRSVPTCLDTPVSLDDSVLQDLVITENQSYSFSGVYNVTEVWGMVLDLSNNDRYAETSTYNNNTYNVTFDDCTSWDDIDNLTQMGVKICSDNFDNPSFSINTFSSIPIVDGDGKALSAGMLKADTVYVFRYRREILEDTVKPKLYLLGQFQCYGKYVENSLKCPFSVPNLGYEILNSVEYNSLSDDASCYNQAEYDTYKTTAMMDTINLSMVVVPWLDVNMKIEYTPKYNGEKNQYIIKSFNWSIGNGTMSVTIYKFIEDFSFVYKKKAGET